jgi:hypothetical protein
VEGKPGEAGNDRYEYFKDLSIQQIIAHLEELRSVFQSIMDRYTSVPLMAIEEQDTMRLTDIIGDLLPMSMSAHVQEEVLAAPDIDPEELLFNRINSLQTDILLFLSTFENTGVKRFSPDIRFP